MDNKQKIYGPNCLGHEATLSFVLCQVAMLISNVAFQLLFLRCTCSCAAVTLRFLCSLPTVHLCTSCCCMVPAIRMQCSHLCIRLGVRRRAIAGRRLLEGILHDPQYLIRNCSAALQSLCDHENCQQVGRPCRDYAGLRGAWSCIMHVQHSASRQSARMLACADSLLLPSLSSMRSSTFRVCAPAVPSSSLFHSKPECIDIWTGTGTMKCCSENTPAHVCWRD